MDSGSHHVNTAAAVVTPVDSLGLESEIINEETLAQLVIDDEHSWLSTDLIQPPLQPSNGNRYCPTNGDLMNHNQVHRHPTSHSDDGEIISTGGGGGGGGDGNGEIGEETDHYLRGSFNNLSCSGQQFKNSKSNSNNENNTDKEDCDLKGWLSDVLENEALKSTKDNLVRELDNLAVLHKLESSARTNKFGRIAIPERNHYIQQQQQQQQQHPQHQQQQQQNLETRWESRLEFNKEAKLDTRTITKRKPTFFNRFLSSEELSPSYGNLANTKLNYSSSNLTGIRTTSTPAPHHQQHPPLHGGIGNNQNNHQQFMESPYTMRKSKLNNTFTMDDACNQEYEEKIPLHNNESFTITRRDQSTPLQLHPQSSHFNSNLTTPTMNNYQQQQQRYLANTATVTRNPNPNSNCISVRKTDDRPPIKKKPISMYSVYAEPTDSRPIRNTNVLSAYRLFKSSALNCQQFPPQATTNRSSTTLIKKRNL